MGVFDNTVIFFLSDNGASAEQIIRGDGHDRKAGLARFCADISLHWSWLVQRGQHALSSA